MARIEHGNATLASDHSLPIQGKGPSLDLHGGASNRWVSVSPVMASAGEQMHRGAVSAHNEPITVVLDLVHPAGPSRRLGGKGGDARVDLAIGANAASEHVVK
jgi:hypothetical protein